MVQKQEQTTSSTGGRTVAPGGRPTNGYLVTAGPPIDKVTLENQILKSEIPKYRSQNKYMDWFEKVFNNKNADSEHPAAMAIGFK